MMGGLFQTGSAEISACGLYRYSLERIWGEHGDRMCFIMLNPSTADAEVDDPTIRRCIGFARREGCGRLEVVNLFAWRATDPKDLLLVRDPVGPLNDRCIRRAGNRSRRIVCAWGAHGGYCQRSSCVLDSLHFFHLECLGTTKGGQPRHPLYVHGSQALIPYAP